MVFHKSYRDAVLKLSDGTGTPVVTTIDVSGGDLKIDIKQNVNVVMNRGVLHEVKFGDDTPIDFSFSYLLEGFVAPTGVTAYEVFTNSGGAAAQIGTRDAFTNVHTVDLVWELLNAAGGVEETVRLDDCFFTDISISEEMPTGKVTVSGKSFSILPVIS